MKEFDIYLNGRLKQANANLPEEKIAVVEQLLEELSGEATGKGILPISLSPTGDAELAEFSTQNSVFAALLRGEQLSIGSTAVRVEKKEQSGTKQKTMLLVMISVGMILIVVIVMSLLLVKPQATSPETVAVENTVTMIPTLVPSVTPATIPTSTPSAPTPKQPAPIVMATPHEQPSLSETTGDPISIEIGDQAFPLIARGVTDQGVWETGESATWLHGTVVRKVIVLPAVKAQKGIDSIILRLRNGTRLVYDELRWLEIGRTEIEFLLSDQPSIIVMMLDDNPSANTRKIILGTWRPLIEETPLIEKTPHPLDLEPQKSDLKRNNKW